MSLRRALAGIARCLLAACALHTAAAHAQVILLERPGGVSLDIAREQHMGEEVLASLLVGEPLWLTADVPASNAAALKRRFLGLLAEPPPNARANATAFLLLHGIGTNPEHGVVGVLRQRLAEAGNATLSIQLPVLDWAATSDEYYPIAYPEAKARIGVAWNWLQQRGYRRLVLLSYGLGSRMANYWLTEPLPGASASAPLPAAWITVSHWGQYWNNERLRMPMLDVVAQIDVMQSLAGAPSRGALLAGRPGSRQATLANADAEYNGQEASLLALIRGFLDGLPR